MFKPTKLCHNCFKPHQHLGIYCPQCDKTINNMNELLEKAKKDYPKGTKVKSLYSDKVNICIGAYLNHSGTIYAMDENEVCITLFDSYSGKWAEIIKEETTLLEKARQMYPKGTKFESLYKSNYYVVTKPIFIRYENVYTFDENGDIRCIYDIEKNKWAEIINQSNMTQQEFNDLKVGDFINNYEILHKYNEFLIVRCEDGHDLFDLNKINKLGLKVTPKTFMGLEIKKYDSVPCEIDDKELYYLFEVSEKAVLLGAEKHNMEFYFTPNSIRIL